MEGQRPKIALKRYTRSVRGELSYTTTVWRLCHGEGNQTLLSDSQCGAEEICARKGREQDDDGGNKSNHHTNAPQFHEKSKTCRGQNKWPNRRQKNCPFSSSCLPQLLTFAFFKRQSQGVLPFPHITRTGFIACIVISILFKGDSGLKAYEAQYNCMSLQERQTN